jgi:nicotinamidase-related amidase
VEAVQEALPAEAAVLPKITFSAAGDAAIAERVAALRGEGRDQLVICGAEAHVCVLQTALAFRNAGFNVFVVADAVSSRSQHSVNAACARLLHAGCHWVTTEMVVFEWMERAATDDFRALSPLIR